MFLLNFLKKITINLLLVINSSTKTINKLFLTVLDNLYATVTSLFDALTAPLTRATALKTTETLEAGEVLPSSSPTESVKTNITSIFHKVKDLPVFDGSFFITLRTFGRGAYVFFRDACKRTFGFGFYYLQGLVFVLAVDAALTDDEPL